MIIHFVYVQGSWFSHIDPKNMAKVGSLGHYIRDFLHSPFSMLIHTLLARTPLFRGTMTQWQRETDLYFETRVWEKNSHSYQKINFTALNRWMEQKKGEVKNFWPQIVYKRPLIIWLYYGMACWIVLKYIVLKYVLRTNIDLISYYQIRHHELFSEWLDLNCYVTSCLIAGISSLSLTEPGCSTEGGALACGPGGIVLAMSPLEMRVHM